LAIPRPAAAAAAPSNARLSPTAPSISPPKAAPIAASIFSWSQFGSYARPNSAWAIALLATRIATFVAAPVILARRRPVGRPQGQRRPKPLRTSSPGTMMAASGDR